MAIIDATAWQELTGQTVSGAAATALDAWCAAVSKALANAIKPWSAEPVTRTNQVYDAPAQQLLLLRTRPVRSITSIYYNASANGDVSLFTADTLLDNTDNGAYSLVVDDDATGWSLAGMVRRTTGVWGWTYFRPPTMLGYRLQAEPGSLLLNYAAGFTTVPEDIQAAAAHLVTKNMSSRKFGMQVTSASLNGGSYSLPATAVGNVWADPQVAFLLQQYKSVHIG
jgi:hypothetical protein